MRLAGVGRVVRLGERLHVLARLGDHEHVHQQAGDLHLLGRDAPRRHNALHLRDHQAAAVVCRLRQPQTLAGHRLALHADVAALVRRAAAHQAHVDGERPVPQPLAPAQGDHLDREVARDGVERAPLQAGVYESAQTHVRDRARPAGRDVAVEVGDHPLGQAVGFDLLLDGQLAQARRQVPVPADDLPHQAGVPEVVQAALAAIALAGGVDQRQAVGGAGLQEPALDGVRERLRVPAADEPAGRDRAAVRDKRHRLSGRKDAWVHGGPSSRDDWSDGVMEWWSNGVMEWWGRRRAMCRPAGANTPTLQYSMTPFPYCPASRRISPP